MMAVPFAVDPWGNAASSVGTAVGLGTFLDAVDSQASDVEQHHIHRPTNISRSK